MTKAPGMSGRKAAPPQPTVRQYLAVTALRALEEMTVDVREGAGGAMKPLAAFIAWRYRDDDSMSPENALEALERTKLISFSQTDHAYHVREAWLSISGRLQGLPVPGARVLTPERIKRLYAWQRAGCQSFTDTQADTDPPEGWEPPSKPEVLKEAKKSLPPPPPPLEEPEIDLFPVVSDLSSASRLLRAARRPFDTRSFRLILLAHSKGNEAEADKLQQALVKKGCYQSDGRGIISLVQRVVASFTHGRALVWSSDEELRKILEIPPEVRPESPPPRITPPSPKPEVVALAEPLVPDELNERFRTVSGTLAKNVLVLEENLPGSCVPEDIFLYVAKPIAGGTPVQAHNLLVEYLALGFLVQSQQDGTLVLSRDGRTWAETQKMRPNVKIDLLRRLYPGTFSPEVQEPTPPVEAVVSAPAEEIKEPEAETAAPNPPKASSERSGEEDPPNTNPGTFHVAPSKTLRVTALLNPVQKRWGGPMPTRLTDMVAEKAGWDRQEWCKARANAGSPESKLLAPTKGEGGRSIIFWEVTPKAKTIVEEQRYDPSLSADDVDTVIAAYRKAAEIPVPTAVAEITVKSSNRGSTDPRDPAKGHVWCQIIDIHLRVEEMLEGPVASTLSNALLDGIIPFPQPTRTNMKTGGMLHDASSFKNVRNRQEVLWLVTDAGRQFLLEHPLPRPPLSDEEIRKRIETWKAKNTPAAPAPKVSEPPPHVEAPVSEPVAPSIVVVAEGSLPDSAAATPSLPSVETNDGEEEVEEAPLPLSPLLGPTLPTEENARVAANLDNIRAGYEKEIALLHARLWRLQRDSQSLAEAATRLDGKPRK